MKEREKTIWQSAKMKLAVFALCFNLLIFACNTHSVEILRLLLELNAAIILVAIGARAVNQLGDNAETAMKKPEPKS